MTKLICFLVLSLAVAGIVRPPQIKPANPEKEITLADLLSLPDGDYKVDPYVRAAQSLQALEKGKAIALLNALAVKDDWPSTRTVCLCRMLFQAKPAGTFRRAGLGDTFFPGRTKRYEDWPSEPIELVDGVPFRVVNGYLIGGFPEPAQWYLGYCVNECDWNTFQYAPKSIAQKRQALETLLASPKLQGKVDDSVRKMFADQIR